MREKRSIFDNKRAQRGVSMPLALLLFLICALLASVVLSASSAASGRHNPVTVNGETHNQLAVSDQAYYSVASAAGIFQEEYSNTPVTIVCEQDKRVTTTSTINGSSTTTGTPTEETTGFVVRVDGQKVFDGMSAGDLSTSGLSLVELSAVKLAFAGTSVNPSKAWTDDLPVIENFVNVGDFDVACSVNAPSSGTSIDTAKAAAALAVKVQGKLLDDGRLQLRFDSNGPGQTNAASYSLTLYLDADADIDVQTEEGATEVTTTGTTRTETKTVKTLRTVTVTWTASELVKTAGGSA